MITPITNTCHVPYAPYCHALITVSHCYALSTVPYCYGLLTVHYCSALSGFAFNLAIPVLVKLLGDSTVVPLLRAVALPLAALVAMSRLDPVIATSFDWDALVGLTLAFAGLLVCYLPPNRVCACIATPPPPMELSSGNVQYK